MICFQNDLIRFIGDKLDKKSKLILVCMRYFMTFNPKTIGYWGENKLSIF
jgi:hypothetical protein